MDNFLAEASLGGKINSSGEFTISHYEALRKLREFQLPRMGALAANLVAAVVLGGGTYIQVSADHLVLRFTFDKPLFSEEDLEMLFLSPFHTGAPKWRKELAIAANGTLGLPLKYLGLESWHGNQGWEMKTFGGDKQEVQKIARPLAKSAQSRFSLHFGYRRGFKLENYSTPIYQELRTRCCYAPLDIRFNSRSLSRSPIAESDIARKVWRTHSSSPGAVLPGQARKAEESQHQEPFTAIMELVEAGAGEVQLVVNGVSFPAPSETFDLPDWVRLVVAAPELQKDLSQVSITMSEELQHISNWASAQLKTVLEDHCRTFQNLERNSLRHFRFCLNQVYPEVRPQAVESWFEHQELLDRARSAQKFDELMEKARTLTDPLRSQSLWRALSQAQWRALGSAWSERDWEATREACHRLELASRHSTSLSDMALEALESAQCLIDGKVPSREPRDAVWSSGRLALGHGLVDQSQEAFRFAGQLSGFWKHYLMFQLSLPDIEAALPHLERAISASHRAHFALNDLAEIRLLQAKYPEALRLRREFLKRRPAGQAYWNQVMRLNARAHGTRSQFAFWTAYTGLAELTTMGKSARALVMGLVNRSASDWAKTLEKSETIQLANIKWRFLFHCGLWALRKEGEWDVARRFLFRRLLLASLSDDAKTPTVPALSVL